MPDKNPDEPKHTPDVGVDERRQGPTSLAGLEASELPDKGRGPVETDPGKEGKRNMPQRTGEIPGGDVGLRGTPDLSDADKQGGRKKN